MLVITHSEEAKIQRLLVAGHDEQRAIVIMTDDDKQGSEGDPRTE
jgi:hypothetical protein